MTLFAFDKSVFPHIIQVQPDARTGTFSKATGVQLYSEAMDFADELKDMDVVAPLRAIGKFALGGGVNSDSIFIVQEPWKIRPEDVDHILDLEGTIITDGGIDYDYNNQTAAFTVGEIIIGQTSGTEGIIIADTTSGIGDGTMKVVQIRPRGGGFLNGETVTAVQPGGGSADINSTGLVIVTQPTVAAEASNVTIRITAASSGTVAFSDIINDQSFLMGRVWIDDDRGAPGTAFPRGTSTDPSDNITDALIIANDRDLVAFNLEGLVVLSGENIDDTHWFGTSPAKSRLVLDGGPTEGNTFTDMVLEGIANGSIVAVNCHIGNFTNLQGAFHNCLLGSTTVLDLAGAETIHMVDCYSGIPGVSTPVIDVGTASLAIRRYSGGVKLINKTGSSNVSIDMTQGQVILDSTCVAGTIVVRGVARLEDNSGPGCTVIVDGLLYVPLIVDAVWDEDLSGHNLVGSAGEALGVVVTMSGEVTTLLALAKKIYGIANANTEYEALIFDAEGRATQFRIIGYDTNDFGPGSGGTAVEVERWLFDADYLPNGNVNTLRVKEGL